MNKIFNQAKDKNVAALIIYGKKGESAPAAYTDAACTKKMKTSELKDAVIKRAIIQIGEDIFIPISFTVSSNIGTATYAKAGSSAGSAATATLVAVED